MTAIPAELAERLGWLLLQSLWQFALIGVLCHQVLRCVTHASPLARYRLCLAGLALMVVTSAATAAWLPLPAGVEGATPPMKSSVADDSFPGTGGRREPSSPTDRPLQPPTIEQSDSRSFATWAGWILAIDQFVRPWLSGLALFWCAGLVVFSIRPLAGWLTVCQLRGSGLKDPSETMQALLERTARRFANCRSVAILQSTRVVAPLTIGFLRPLVLIPVSLATSLTARELEAIIAHELAHIQRHDFLVNLLQTLVETVFFYHPAVWWLSHRIRIERENCCDDQAAAALGSRVEYGRALIALEELRNSALILAPGADGGDLLSRIRRLTSDPTAIAPAHPVLHVGTFCLVATLIGIAALFHRSEVLAQTSGPSPASNAAAASEGAGSPPETKSDALTSAPKGDAPFRVRLEGGAVIELKAIGMKAEDDAFVWWDPAGTELKPAEKIPTGDWKVDQRIEVQKDHEIRDIVFKVWKPERAGIEVRNSGLLFGTTMNGMNFIDCRLQVPASREQADFTVRYSNGPWKVAATAEANTEVEVNGVRFSPFDHEGGRTVCRVEHPFADYERQIAAFDQAGKRHEGVANSRQHSGKLLKDSSGFEGLFDDEIARVVLEIRPVTTIEFRNVALHRGRATKPEVMINGMPVARTGSSSPKDADDGE